MQNRVCRFYSGNNAFNPLRIVVTSAVNVNGITILGDWKMAHDWGRKEGKEEGKEGGSRQRQT